MYRRRQHGSDHQAAKEQVMSNSTRQGGYDERLVVPLEASRRGAHRARANPLVAALPLLAVVIVVAGVIGVAYTLFLKQSNPANTGSQSLPAVTSAPQSASAPAGAAPSSTKSGAASRTTSPSPSASAGTSGTVDKSVSFKVYNGSVAEVGGLGRRAVSALQSAGWSGATVVTGPPPSAAGHSQTTRVYVNGDGERATAEAIRKALKVGAVKQSGTIAANGIVVVIGDDYNG
jgi:cytoskeletal protein RodZ